MTMPHLMNCLHSDDGWCLSCVKQLAEQRAELLAALTVAVANIERWQETGIPAGPEESRAIYERMKAAVTKATGERA